jgi:acetyl-CoA acyltransferase
MTAKNTLGPRRVAVVDGLRTPFCRMSGEFSKMSAIDLGTAVVSELLQRSGLPSSEIQRVVYGQVVPKVSAPNIAR